MAILVSAAVWLQPLNRAWSARAWVILMQVCALSSAYKVCACCVMPRLLLPLHLHVRGVSHSYWTALAKHQ